MQGFELYLTRISSLCMIKLKKIDNGFEYQGLKMKGDKISGITFTHVPDTLDGKFIYYGIWAGGLKTEKLSAVLSHVRCYDEKGNNLGIESNLEIGKVRVYDGGEAEDYTQLQGGYYCEKTDTAILLKGDKTAVKIIEGVKEEVPYNVYYNSQLNLLYQNGMGTYLTLYTPKTSTSSVTVASIDMRPVEQLPTGLTKLGFKDFGIDANMYESASVKGQYKGKSLDGTLFNGKITFSKEGNAYLMIGGKEPWGGFGLTTAVNEKTGEAYLQLYDTKSGESKARFSRFSFYSSVAGVQLVDKELDLSLSIQYVDRDGDGKKNDIKLGVWFAGVLYNNRYIYLTDYTNTKHSMGTWMTIYATKGATVGVGSLDEWLDFSVYGLTADWETTLLNDG